jgi:hypothetical protein
VAAVLAVAALAAAPDDGPRLAGPPQLVLAPDPGPGRVAVVVRTDRPLRPRAGVAVRGRVTLAGARASLRTMRVLHNSPCYVAHPRPATALRRGRRYALRIVLEGRAVRRSAVLRRLPRGERRGAALRC